MNVYMFNYLKRMKNMRRDRKAVEVGLSKVVIDSQEDRVYSGAL